MSFQATFYKTLSPANIQSHEVESLPVTISCLSKICPFLPLLRLHSTPINCLLVVPVLIPSPLQSLFPSCPMPGKTMLQFNSCPLFTCTHSILTNSQLLSNSIWNAHSMLEKLEREIISCWLKKGTRNSGVCYKWFQKGETMSSHSIHSRAPLGGLRRVLFHQDTSLEYKSLGNQRWCPMYL